jgi:hypothetical protein
MTDRESTLLGGRVKKIEQLLGRPLPPLPGTHPPSLESVERDHLRENAEDLYWNELEWEKITGEERLDEEFLTEMAFPGFLAFVRGLLLSVAMPDSQVPANPAPEVVCDVLRFLAGRVVELEEEAANSHGEEKEHREAELHLTSRLVDLVLYTFFDFSPEEVEKVEAALAGD